MREKLKKHNTKLIVFLCAVIALLLVTGEFNNPFVRAPRLALVDINVIEAITEEESSERTLERLEQLGLHLVSDATLSNFIVQYSGGIVFFSGTVQYGDRVFEFCHNSGAIFATELHGERVNGLAIAVAPLGSTDQLGYRILDFRIRETSGIFIIQCVETRGIMMFRFPFSEDTYRRLHNVIPNVIHFDVVSRLTHSDLIQNALPGLEHESLPIPN